MEGRAEGIEPFPLASQTAKNEWVAAWLDELCPYYMALGVSCEDFWHGDYTQFKFYVQAHDLIRQKQSEYMWLMGAYNFRAFATALSNFHLDGKRHRFNQYSTDIIRVIPYTEAEKEMIAERERQKTIKYFDQLAKNWQKEVKL